ncbi:hypothetical protein H8L32_01765 [Undibacterium sp. CY18W]|uniref:KAP NTPase domain-containing protein n=1 Tax=Undibacterium hunanense TaxID=2762292 RepID=A0ABR6ZJX2_9BURK|nr:P-loop NTPase fold protein [Undibacterium hunanense]MBC3916201.1 hypothetical protein [Undibacterium hunanense]
MHDQVEEADDSEIWKGDFLEREKEGANLLYFLQKRNLTKTQENGFVLAINGKWGSGKSFFVQRLCKEAQKQKHPTLFFDAWKNDFTKDPLLAFIAEFNSSLNKYLKHIPLSVQAKEQALEALNKIWKPALKIIGFTIVKQVAGLSSHQIKELFDSDEDLDDEDLEVKMSSDAPERKSDAYSEAARKLNTAISKALNEHRTIKESIRQFKKQVGALIQALDSIDGIQLPIIVFVDELDRCRPDYAIELLEGIKHLFGVRGVYFVISTNLEQLSHSVKAVYGSKFDGHTYLRRFFDLQYSLPEPSTKQFCLAITAEMSLPDISHVVYGLGFLKTMTGQVIVPNATVDVVAYVLELHANAFDLSLRDLLQVTTILDVAFALLDGKQVHIFFLVFLAVLYHRDVGVYSLVVNVRHLEQITGFPTVDPKNGRGAIEFRNDSGQPTMVLLSTVAALYFKSMGHSSTEWNAISFAAQPRYGFPGNLIYTDCDSMFKSHLAAGEFSFYPDLIRRTGGFSKLESN